MTISTLFKTNYNVKAVAQNISLLANTKYTHTYVKFYNNELNPPLN